MVWISWKCSGDCERTELEWNSRFPRPKGFQPSQLLLKSCVDRTSSAWDHVEQGSSLHSSASGATAGPALVISVKSGLVNKTLFRIDCSFTIVILNRFVADLRWGRACTPWPLFCAQGLVVLRLCFDISLPSISVQSVHLYATVQVLCTQCDLCACAGNKLFVYSVAGICV